MATKTERLEQHDHVEDLEPFEFEPFEIDGIHFLSPEEGRELFDREAQRLFGISGDEFLRRWDSGEYGPIPDTPEGRKLGRMYGLIPFARRTPA
jgi:hypothetical protein